MATFTGGETVVSTTSANGTAGSSPVTAYTVPAGRYARVTLNNIKNNGTGGVSTSLSIGGAVFTLGEGDSIVPFIPLSGSTTIACAPNEFVLLSGEGINITNSGGSTQSTPYSFTVIEYNNP